MVSVYILSDHLAVELPLVKVEIILQLVKQTAEFVSINRIKKYDYESIQYEFTRVVSFNGQVVSGVHIIKKGE